VKDHHSEDYTAMKKKLKKLEEGDMLMDWQNSCCEHSHITESIMSLQTQCNHKENSKVTFHRHREKKNPEIIMGTQENLNS
jgi:hypothetical protein